MALALPACEAIHAFQRRTLFPSDGLEPGDPSALASVVGLERLTIDVPGGRVEALYLPPLDAPAEGTTVPLVVFAHGNRELADRWPAILEPYRRMGFAVLVPEYRGYGRSEGAPSEEAIVSDFARFYDLLLERSAIDPTRVVLHGRSLGGGVAGVLSSRRRAAALILESTFTNVPDVASEHFAPAGFIADRFDTRDVLLRASIPVLILHGRHDDVVGLRHALELDRVAWDSRVVTFRAGHDLPRDEPYWSAIRAFLREAHVLPDPPGGALDEAESTRASW